MNMIKWFRTLFGLNPPVLGIFGGVGEAIFGESPSAEIESGRTVGPGQVAVNTVLKELFTGTGKLPASIASPDQGSFQAFEDPIVAGLSDLEQLSLAGIEELTSGIAAGGVPGQGQEVAGASQQALLDLLAQGPQDFEDFFQSAVAQPLIEQFNEEILPGISRRNASGFFGSERIRADERAAEDLSEALAGTRGELAFTSRENQLNRVLEALGLAPGIAGLGGQLAGEELGLLERGLAAGSVPREVETSQLVSLYEEFLRGQKFDERLINQMIGFGTAPTTENIGIALGGSEGLIGPALTAIGGAFGGPVGAKVGSTIGGGLSRGGEAPTILP